MASKHFVDALISGGKAGGIEPCPSTDQRLNNSNVVWPGLMNG